MEGFIAGGPSEGSTVRLIRNLTFRLLPATESHPELSETIPHGTVGVVVHNGPADIVVTFGNKTVRFVTQEQIASLNWD